MCTFSEKKTEKQPADDIPPAAEDHSSPTTGTPPPTERQSRKGQSSSTTVTSTWEGGQSSTTTRIPRVYAVLGFEVDYSVWGIKATTHTKMSNLTEPKSGMTPAVKLSVEPNSSQT